MYEFSDVDTVIADKLMPFVLDYCKDLHERVTTSKSQQVVELQQRLTTSESQVSLYRDRLESEQVMQIESTRRKAETDVELKMKDIEIERLKRKATKDSEHLVEQVKILEDRLQEKQDEIKGL